MKLLILISLLTFGALTVSSQVYVRPTTEPIKTKVIKTVSSRVVGARTFNATAYCLTGKMANGQRVHSGAIAADPRVLKLGTRVKIHGMGTYVVKDTGGAIKGNRLDIWMGCREARLFGRRSVDLTVVE